MRALTWHGKRDVRIDTAPDPKIVDPTDIIVPITSTGICGSDLHLYEVQGPYLDPGDILGHEPLGVVEEVGPEVTAVAVGDRVVVPFNISCGTCWMCTQGLHSQCETTQVTDRGMGAALFGFSKLYGQVPGAPSRVATRPLRQHSPCQSAPRPAGPALRLPLRRSPDRVAVRRLRRHPAGRDRHGPGAGARSATWPPASPCTRAPARSLAWTSSPNVWRGPGPGVCLRHPHAAARRRAAGVQDLPGQGGRHDQDRPHALNRQVPAGREAAPGHARHINSRGAL